MLLGWFAVPIWGRIPVSKSGPEIHVLGDFFNRFWSRFWDRNPVPKSGPPKRIHTRRSRFRDRNPVPKSGPQTSPKSIPCVAKIWPRGPDFGTGFLSPNRDPKVVHKVDQDVYFPTSSGCAFRWDFDVARMFWLRARILTQPREQHLCPAKLGWPLARACQ